ncbi:SGNH/GDSL hydrolase family protein [Winogradskyella aurantiaca]|uniref:SGNH/GDSL hydrolase family protein n=1 Tax=Winogradskyella aurantiaca TaxID=2219558 RepID=UPI000E1C8580|nr:SGNH/GDSL hydrolase family protein [Winogradskyella aurantiaca]
MKYLFLFFTLCLSFSWNLPGQSKDELRLLFIGNSLTYTNNLPNLVLLRAQKDKRDITTEMIALPNYALVDHWNDQSIQKAIAQGNYDFVIVQQGPSSQDFGRQVLIDYGQRIKDLCDEHGSQLMFFMVWPSKAYYYTFEKVIKNHYDAAKASNALVCPVGLKWKELTDNNPESGLYGPDGFHPSRKGSDFAASEIYKCVLDNKN